MKTCFVICPIGEEGSEIRKGSDEAFDYIIKPSFSGMEYEVVRADKLANSGMITQAIIDKLLTAEIAIADLTGNNPNVFYELAIRHCYGKPTIQITRGDFDKIPFDVHNMNTIKYDLSAKGADTAKTQIEKLIKALEKNGKQTTPVSEVTKILSLETNSADSGHVLSDLLLKVNSIPNELNRLETSIEARFSQLFSAFAQSFQTNANTQAVPSEDDLKNLMLQKFLDSFMNDPVRGVEQMKGLMSAQRLLEDEGIISKD